VIFVGDDWAEDHHDVHLMDETGARLASRRLPEGLAGIGEFHQLLAHHTEEPDQVMIGIETDRGLWVEALIAAGYRVYAINPLAAARYRDRHHVSGPSPMLGTPNCWLIWCAPTATTTAGSPVTLQMPTRSRCWLGRIRI
jgi:Transposase